MSATRSFLRLWATATLLVFSSACASQTERPVAGSGAAPAFTMQTYGSLNRAMVDGDTEPKLSLGNLRGDTSLIGLGSLSGFRGELLMAEGEIWVSYPKDDGTAAAKALAAGGEEVAAFAVTARVPKWQGLPIHENVKFEDLEEMVEKLATDAGLDVERPFPFIIDGALVELAFHVVDGRPFPPRTPLNEDALMAAAVKTKRATTPGLIVGFYSKREAPEFLHPETHVHLHVLVRADNQMGHVDHVDLPSGITFRVPLPG